MRECLIYHVPECVVWDRNMAGVWSSTLFPGWLPSSGEWRRTEQELVLSVLEGWLADADIARLDDAGSHMQCVFESRQLPGSVQLRDGNCIRSVSSSVISHVAYLLAEGKYEMGEAEVRLPFWQRKVDAQSQVCWEQLDATWHIHGTPFPSTVPFVRPRIARNTTHICMRESVIVVPY